MVFECKLCEKETCLTTNICHKCRRIKHLINLYDEKVYSVLENCLVRTEEQITRKENFEIKKEEDEIKSVIQTRSKKN
jgi:hypothetical protein